MGIEPFEDVRAIVSSAVRWTAVPCACRRQSRSCDSPVDVCLMLGRGAEYYISSGAGSDLTVEQALVVIDRAAEAGLVHTIATGRGEPSCICNCCTDCCVNFRSLLTHAPDEVERGHAKSRFEARIDKELCSGCEICIDRCPFGAITAQEMPQSGPMQICVDVEKCWGCGSCVTGCPDKAAFLKLVRPLEYVTVRDDQEISPVPQA